MGDQNTTDSRHERKDTQAHTGRNEKDNTETTPADAGTRHATRDPAGPASGASTSRISVRAARWGSTVCQTSAARCPTWSGFTGHSSSDSHRSSTMSTNGPSSLPRTLFRRARAGVREQGQ